MTGNKVDKVHADGAYQSMENRELAADKENGLDFIVTVSMKMGIIRSSVITARPMGIRI